MAPKIAIIIYSMYSPPQSPLMNRYGHIKKMADAEAEGVRAAGYDVDLYQYIPIRSLFSVNM
jgi:hypothetical protein